MDRLNWIHVDKAEDCCRTIGGWPYRINIGSALAKNDSGIEYGVVIWTEDGEKDSWRYPPTIIPSIWASKISDEAVCGLLLNHFSKPDFLIARA